MAIAHGSESSVPPSMTADGQLSRSRKGRLRMRGRDSKTKFAYTAMWNAVNSHSSGPACGAIAQASSE